MGNQTTKSMRRTVKQWSNRQRKLFLMVIPFTLFVMAFSYVPLFGLSMAFMKYRPGISFFKQEFVGMNNFRLLFSSMKDILMVMKNTLVLSGLEILIMPLSLIFAILLSELPWRKLAKTAQTVSALPHYISYILLYAVFYSLFSPTDGAVNSILRSFWGPDYTSNIMASAKYAWLVQVLVSVYKGTGYGAIMYLSAMAGIDQEMYDSAKVDGAGRMARILYITLPGVLSTFVVLLVFKIAGVLSGAGFDQYYIFQNPMTMNKLEVLDTYIYKIGLQQNNFGFATATGLLKSVVSIMLLFLANQASKAIRGVGII